MSHFDRLPDGILLRIFMFVMARNTVFYIDEFSCRAQDDVEAMNIEKSLRASETTRVFHPTTDSYNEIEICGRLVNAEFFGEFNDEVKVTSRPGRSITRVYCKQNVVYPSQKVHVKDWVLIHSISRRILDIGRYAFFLAKSIAMAITLPPKIHAGGVPFLRNAEVRRIALANTIDLTLTNLRTTNPSEFLALPQRTRLFPNLEYCTCLVKSHKFETPDINDLKSRRKMYYGLDSLLCSTGVSPRVKLFLSGMFEGEDERRKWDEMQVEVYPWVQSRVFMLQEKILREWKSSKSLGKRRSSGEYD